MFFADTEDKSNLNNLIKIAALLIHAAKIDENYSIQELKIIKQALFEFKNSLKSLATAG